MSRKAAAFIASYKRPDRVKTVRTLQKHGYTGDWYIICDDLDPTLEQYMRRYRERVIVYSKKEIAPQVDTMDNLERMDALVYSCVAMYYIARERGLTHFVLLGDDYQSFEFLYNYEGKIIRGYTYHLDKLFDWTYDLLDETPALAVAWAQTGDLIGGKENRVWLRLFKRKLMNVIFCRTDRPVRFMGRTNQDVNAYVYHGMRGDLVFTLMNLLMKQERTQRQSGGNTDLYRDLGTHVKSFYSVMLAPSCVREYLMVSHWRRVHHYVDWEHCVPKILSEKYRKLDNLDRG